MKYESEVGKLIKALYVDTELLNKKIDNSGLKRNYLAECLALTKQGFSKKVKGATPFRATEVYVLCDKLNISDDEKVKIFTPKVE